MRAPDPVRYPDEGSERGEAMLSRPRARGTAPVAVAVAAVAALFWALHFRPGGHSAPLMGGGDLRIYFYPYYDAAYRWMASGVLPLWNPYQLCGIPWIGTVQGGLFYPVHALYLALPTYLALALSGLLHLIFVAVATMAFARTVGLAMPAAALAALLFPLRGIMPSWLVWPYLLEAAAWLPLGSLAVLRLTREPGTRPVGILALATGMSALAGGPQATAYLVYAWAALLVSLLVFDRARRVDVGVALGSFAAAVLLGGLIGAVQLLPALEMTREGLRTASTLSTAVMVHYEAAGSAIVRGIVDDGSRYLGVVGLVLIPAALLGARHRAIAISALVVGGFAFLFALGPSTRLFAVYRVLPLLGWFRQPSRIGVLLDFAFAILAAVGLDALVRAGETGAATSPRDRRAGVLLLVTLAAALALAGRDALRGVAVPAMIALAAAGAVALAVVGGARVRGVVAGIFLALAAAQIFPGEPIPTMPPYTAAAAAAYRRHDVAFERLARLAGHDRVWLVGSGIGTGVDFTPKLATRYGLRSIQDYEPLSLRRQAEYWRYLERGASALSRSLQGFEGRASLLVHAPHNRLTATAVLPRRRLVDLAAVRFVLMTESLQTFSDVPDFIAGMGLEARDSGEPGLVLLENPRALPRAFVAYRASPAPPVAELLEHLSRDDFDPMRESYVEGSVDAPVPTAPARGAPATIVRDDPRVVELDVDLAAPGLVVLSDTFYPGWRATVDGTAAPIYATNHVFRGVPAPAGRHRVRFSYAPWSVTVGALLSVAGTAAACVLLAGGRREVV